MGLFFFIAVGEGSGEVLPRGCFLKDGFLPPQHELCLIEIFEDGKEEEESFLVEEIRRLWSMGLFLMVG